MSVNLFIPLLINALQLTYLIAYNRNVYNIYEKLIEQN